MFEALTSRFDGVFDRLRGRARLSDRDVNDALSQVRRALLEADVNVEVVRRLLDRIRRRAVGAEVMKSITPGHQVVKVVHEELIETLGREAVPLVAAESKPLVTLMVGLQGSGKTTSAAKLGWWHQRSGKRVLLVAADLVRPGAVEQLRLLGNQIGADVFTGRRSAASVVRGALRHAGHLGVDVVIIDTAGRLQIDARLMRELNTVTRISAPDEVLLVVDALTGQQAVSVAEGFLEHTNVSGVILSKLDSDARGGAAISVREATGCPIKLVGTGERPEDLEVFHPERMASRILGMGDILTLVEKAEEALDEEQADEIAERLLRDEFTLEDFLDQVRNLRKMGSFGELLGMIPGARTGPADTQAVDRQVRRSEAIIRSMTPAERASPRVIEGSRKRRIALGSGTSVQDVSGLLKQFDQMRNMMQALAEGKALGGLPGMSGPGGGLPGMPGMGGGLPGMPGMGMPRRRRKVRAGGRRPPAGSRSSRKKPRTPKKLQKKKRKR